MDVPDNFSSFLHVVGNGFLEIRYLHGVRPTFQADYGRFIWAVASYEVVEEGRSIQGS